MNLTLDAHLMPTAEEAACLLKIAHGLPMRPDAVETLARLEPDLNLVWSWAFPPASRDNQPRLTEYGRYLLNAYLAAHGEDA